MHRLRKRFAPKQAVKPEQAVKTARAPIYSSPYPLSWWSRFKDACSISMLPWDIIGNYEGTILIPSDGLARAFYAAAAWFERQLPSAAVHFWGYTIIILDRN
jgi:hypothetical protein